MCSGRKFALRRTINMSCLLILSTKLQDQVERWEKKLQITVFKQTLFFQFVPILLVLSTSSMLLLDQRTLQIKYRIPASELYRMSLSPYLDDVAVFHVKAVRLLYNFIFSGYIFIAKCRKNFHLVCQHRLIILEVVCFR